MFSFLLALLFGILLYSSAAFDIRCPDPSHRRFRALRFCNNLINESMYSCLLDINSNIYIETCTQPKDFVPAGEKYVISGHRTNIECGDKRYQPFKFWSDAQSLCIYSKSFCNEVGQIMYSLGSKTEDCKCSCDYTNGYRFVTPPKNICYCIPSQEDCTCYFAQCQGYTCRENLLERKMCRERLEVLGNTNSTNNDSLKEEVLETSFLRKGKSIFELIIALTTMIIVSVLLCVAVSKRTKLLRIVYDTLECIQCSKIKKKPHDHFVERIIGKWSNFKKAFPATTLFKELSECHFISVKDCMDMKKESLNKQCLFFLQTLKDNSTNAKNTNQLVSILWKQGPQIRDILAKSVLVQRWPKRNEDECKEIIKSCTTIRNLIEPIYCVDDFFESFIFDFDEYTSIINHEASREKMTTSLLDKIEANICKGSFECLLTVLKRNEQPAEIFTELQTKLVQAISFQLKSIQENNTAVHIPWKCFRFDIKSGDTNESLLDKVLLERIKQCSKWFVEEVAMYPQVDIDKSEIVLLPLVENVFKRLGKNIRNTGFNNLLDLIFYKSETLKTRLNVNTLKVVLREHHLDQKINQGKLETIDHRLILRVTRKFLERNIQPSMITDEFRQNRIVSGLKSMTVVEIIDMLEKSNSKHWKNFLRILEKNNMTYILRQLQGCDPVLLRNNIIQKMSTLVEIDFAQIDPFYEEFCLSTYKDFLKNNRDKFSDNNEQMMLLFMVKTLQAGSLAMLEFVHFLFNSDYQYMAESLFSKSIPMEMKTYADKTNQFDKTLNVLCEEYDIIFETVVG